MASVLASAGPVISRLRSSTVRTPVPLPRAACSEAGPQAGAAGDHQPDGALGAAPGQLDGLPVAITPAAVDDVHLVGEPLGLVHEVRGQHDRHAVGAQLVDQVPGGAPGLRVHAGGRLVEEDQLGSAHDGHRQREPLLLAAGEPAVRRAAAGAQARAARSAASTVERVGVQGGDVPQHLLGADAATRRRRTAASRRSAGAASRRWRRGSRPSTLTRAASGTAVALAGLEVVVLPAPLGPSTAVTVPCATVRSRPSTAVLSPYRLTRSSTSTAGS